MNTLPHEIENIIYTYYNPYKKNQKKLLKHLTKKIKRKCEYCGKFNSNTRKSQNRNKKCSLCLKAYYCSFRCYKTHYSDHRLICNGLIDNID